MSWTDPRIIAAFAVFAYFVYTNERSRAAEVATTEKRLELQRQKAAHDRELQEVNQKIRLYEIQNKAKHDAVDNMPADELDSLWATIHR